MRRLGVGLALLLVAALAFGQAQTTGRVTGVAKDEAGQPIAGATVKIEGGSLQGAREVVADQTGRFALPLLPPGDYLLSVNAPGKQEAVVAFALALGRTLDMPVTLLNETRVEIEVLGTASKLATTANGENFNYDKLVENLPIPNRTIEAVAFNAPNITRGPNGTDLSISGANAFDTVVLLEGAEISDPFFGDSPTVYIEDAIDEVEVLTSGVSARYGRFAGGVLNAVTKRGGNEFTGTVRTELTNEKWNSTSPFGEDQADDLSKVFSGTAGGYILKDKLWWFGAARKFDSSNTVTAGNRDSATSETSEKRFQGKLRGAITPNHIVEGAYLSFDSDVAPLTGLPAGEASAFEPMRKDPRDFYTVGYQGIFSSSVFADVSATKKKVAIQAGGTDTQHSPLLDLSSFLVYNNSWFDGTQRDARDNDTVNASVSYTTQSGKHGTHTIDGGVQRVRSTTSGDNRQSASGFNLLNLSSDLTQIGPDGRTFNLTSFSDDGFNLRWEAVPLGGDQRLDYTAAYVEDTWNIGKWRLDAGLRYESYTGDGPLSSNLIDFSDTVPRLGVTYNAENGWQYQVTWGRYLGRFNDSYAQNASGVGGAPRFTSLYVGDSLAGLTRDEMEAALRDDTGWLTIGFDGPQYPTTVLESGIQSAYSQEFNLAVKHGLPGGKGEVALTYTNRNYKDLIDDFYGGGKLIEVPNPDGGDPFEFDQTVWRNNPNAKREYQGIALTWDYRPSGEWSWGGNYTYATLRGNYVGEAGNQPANGSPDGDYPDSVFPGTAVSFGNLPGDITHRVRTWATYRHDFQRRGALVVGALGRYASGDVWERVAAVAYPYDDPNSVADSGSYNYYFEPRGSHRFNASWALDTSVRYQLPLYKDLAAWVKLDVNNILNNDTLTSFDTSGTAETLDNGQLVFRPNSTFGKAQGPGNYQAPRSFLVTLGLRF